MISYLDDIIVTCGSIQIVFESVQLKRANFDQVMSKGSSKPITLPPSQYLPTSS